MFVSPSAGLCKRCQSLRADVQFARVAEPRAASWKCPDCGMSAVPITPAMAGEGEIAPSTSCPCASGGPLQLVRDVRRSARTEWWWVCAACGLGRPAWHMTWD
jgi:hypothetical protein